MNDDELKSYFQIYLERGREAVLWKLDGLSEYDVRRPMTPTGTNLLGLVKHLTFGEGWYFGNCFDRPFPEPLDDWMDDDPEPNSDLYARPDESRAFIIERYRRACAHADATIDAVPPTRRDLCRGGPRIGRTPRSVDYLFTWLRRPIATRATQMSYGS
jgi:hypothetical protein